MTFEWIQIVLFVESCSTHSINTSSNLSTLHFNDEPKKKKMYQFRLDAVPNEIEFVCVNKNVICRVRSSPYENQSKMRNVLCGNVKSWMHPTSWTVLFIFLMSGITEKGNRNKKTFNYISKNNCPKNNCHNYSVDKCVCAFVVHDMRLCWHFELFKLLFDISHEKHLIFLKYKQKRLFIVGK